MPEVSVDIEVWCAECGAGLCNQSSGTVKNRRPGIEVSPCQKCLRNAYNEGYNERMDEEE